MTAVTSLEPRPGLDGRDGTVAVTTWLEHGSDERPLNTADILRGFDGVRRQLSRREFGTDGLGPASTWCRSTTTRWRWRQNRGWSSSGQ